jgi:hypothetical protein
MAKISEKDHEALGLVIDRFQRSEDYCQEWHDQAKYQYEQYRFYKRPYQYPFKHNVKDRLTFTIVEVLTARMMKTLFSVEPFISMVPVEKQDAPIAKQLEKVINILFSNPDREFFLEFTDFVKQNLIYGTSFFSIAPMFDTSNWKFKGFHFNCEDFQDIFHDPAAKRLSRARWCIKRSIQYWDELKDLEKSGVYQNVDMIKGDTVAEWDDPVTERLSDIGKSSEVNYADPKTGRIEIFDYFEEGHIITVGARKVVLRDTRRKRDGRATKDSMGKATKKLSVLPYDLPLIDLRFIPVPREFFGIGIPEILEDDQETIDLLRSQRLDNLDLCINKLFKLRINSDTDPDSIFAAPGGIIPVTDMSDLEEFKISDVTASAYTEADATKRNAEDSVGEWGYGRGETPTHRETATGITKLQEANLIRFDLALKIHEFSGVRTITKKSVQMVREYMSQGDYENLIGEDDAGFYKYSMDDLMEMINIVPVGSAVTANREARSAQISAMHGALSAKTPEITMKNQPTAYVVDQYKVDMAMLDDLQVMNKEEILVKQAKPTPPQPQPRPPARPPGGAPALPPAPGGPMGPPQQGGGIPF